MNFAISWVLGLFKKPPEEINPTKAWPFPNPKEDKDFFGLDRPAKKKLAVKKKLAAKKVVAKKKPVAKKAIKKAK